jgi:uncharacterized protein YndB with AHSA1/START domain
MTDEQTPTRILGSLRLADGRGIVRMQERYATEIEDLWSAITEPERLARWLGAIEGDLRIGGTFRAHFLASGWEGTGTVQACDPPHHLLLMTQDADGSNESLVEVTLAADGAQTLMTWEEQVPPDLLPEYGAGIQVHVEDLAAYLQGRGRCDSDVRVAELLVAYGPLRPHIDP